MALQRGIHSDSRTPSVSKNSFSCGVEPSPTPTMPISGDSSTATDSAAPQRRFSRLAAIQPAVPPPTTITRSALGAVSVMAAAPAGVGGIVAGHAGAGEAAAKYDLQSQL